MTAPLSVRPARHDDLAAMMEIENAAFSQPWQAITFAGMLDRPETVVLVAMAGPQLAGYVVLTTARGEAEVANLAVSPALRGRGVGHALLRESLDVLRQRNVGRAYLAVRASNTVAARLYERFGFREIGSHRSYYRQPPEDARVFALDVSTTPRTP